MSTSALCTHTHTYGTLNNNNTHLGWCQIVENDKNEFKKTKNRFTYLPALMHRVLQLIWNELSFHTISSNHTLPVVCI